MAHHSKNSQHNRIKTKNRNKMKKFSLAWKSSKQKRKQRKYRYKAPLHIRHKFIAANLSKELRKRYSRRSLPLRKGDTIKIMRGSFKKKTGKIGAVGLYNLKVFIEGIQQSKRDGTKVNVPFEPSNLQITELNLEDKKRMKVIERKTKEKPKEKQMEEKEKEKKK